MRLRLSLHFSGIRMAFRLKWYDLAGAHGLNPNKTSIEVNFVQYFVCFSPSITVVISEYFVTDVQIVI